MKQHWIGSTDTTYMLRVIGGWHVCCENEHENAKAVQWAKEQGYLTTRIHHAPAIPEGAEAYELTDSGLERLREWADEAMYLGAKQMRDWYRNHEKDWSSRRGSNTRPSA